MSDPFAGFWRIDVPGSSVWDEASQRYVDDEVGEELIRMEIADGVQDYEVLYGDSPTVRIGYTSRYDDPEWVPYEVREIIAGPEGSVEDQIAGFKARVQATGSRDRDLVVGSLYGEIRTVVVDRRNQFRISRSPRDGTPQSMILRTMEPDGNAFLTSIMGPDGVVFRIRRFVRVAPDSDQALRFVSR